MKGSYLNALDALKFLFKKPHTIRYPKEKKAISPVLRGFHTNDLSKCIGCGDCASVCQCNAIEMVPVPDIESAPGRPNIRPQIDYGRCSYCGLCVDACPTNSLQMSREFTLVSPKTDDFKWMPTERWSDNLGYTADKETSILDFERRWPNILPPARRLTSFEEMVKVYERDVAIEEASRCIECGLCSENCAINMKIPEYIAAIAEGDFEKSAKFIFEDNTLPGICGRVCTKHCEDVCALGVQGEPIAIRFLKRVPIEDMEYKHIIKPPLSSERKEARVAIIGSGPASLTAAYDLSRWGYDVVIFEKEKEPGGAMLYCIPEYRLPLAAGKKDIDFLLSFGAKVETNCEIGRDKKFDELMSEFDAVFLGVGLWKPTIPKMNVSNHEKINFAIEYLKKMKFGEDCFIGDKVVIIGGGNVAIDAARVAKRAQILKNGHEGSVTIVCLEEKGQMPAWPEEIEEAREEGIEIVNGWGIKEVSCSEHTLEGILFKKVVSLFDAQGRFSPEYDNERTQYLECDHMIIAAGQQPDFSFMPEDVLSKLEFIGNKIKVDEFGRTSITGLFAGGDIVNRKGDIVSAIRDGHRAAVGIDKFLKK